MCVCVYNCKKEKYSNYVMQQADIKFTYIILAGTAGRVNDLGVHMQKYFTVLSC